MKKTHLILVITLFFLASRVSAKDYYSTNIGFENGNFNGWTGYTWLYSTSVSSINTARTLVSLPTARRQVIISDTTAYDANTGYALKMIPRGYRYSARLGDEIKSSDTNPRCWDQSLRYTFKVDSTNALFILKFACVLQYSSRHDNVTEFEPRFCFAIGKANGSSIDTVATCGYYNVYSSKNTVKGFQTYTPSSSSDPVKWRDWTSVGANLLDYIGQEITIELVAADCSGKYHYGYAYFVAETHPMYIGVQYCTGDTNAKLIAPEGFEAYSWADSTGTVVGTSQTLLLSAPTEGARYYCTITSATGCAATLSTQIVRYEPNADFSYDLVDCNSSTNTLQFHNTATTKHGNLTYNWDFGDGATASTNNPKHTFTTSGWHSVRLAVANPPSTCTDTVIQQVESFYPPLVKITGDSLYCPGSKTLLKGTGADHYRWSDGSSADSVWVGQDQKIGMVGYSSKGCYTDTIWKNIKSAPYVNFTIEGSREFCKGYSTTVTASALANYTYLWSTGDTTKTITVSQPGTYWVTATSKTGCTATDTVTIICHALPETAFSLSQNTVNSKHNSVRALISKSETGSTYSWDWGDGYSSTGSYPSHVYNVDNQLYDYKITLTATNSYGCTDSTSRTVLIVPYIPNIFTPNNDGVNDYFAAGFETQIFDRWGLKIYDDTKGWDGKFNGKALSPDTYFYLINYTDAKGARKTLKGYVILKR